MRQLRGSVILVTGGTGSFGGAFVQRMRAENFKEVRIFSRDELKQDEMRQQVDESRVRFYIGDVRDRDSVDNAMQGVDCVFHAAAMKQVPTCEFFPVQAVLTNVLGSHNVIESAVKHGVKRLICLSTDKAVYPINAMGMTKALMERVAQAAARSYAKGGTIISSVRYGNVMCSRGSVIPLFIRQLERGEPLTVTVPEMTRFMLPLREAIDLVVFAFEHGRQGDVFIRKSPAATIGDLVKALEKVFDLRAEVKIIGRRHGEKIYEVLASGEELRRSEDMGEYLRVRMDERDLNYSGYFSEGHATDMDAEEYTSHNTRRLEVEELAQLLASLPEVRAELDEITH